MTSDAHQRKLCLSSRQGQKMASSEISTMDSMSGIEPFQSAV